MNRIWLQPDATKQTRYPPCLASALVFLMRDKGKSNRTVHALALRVGFSILLFIFLLVAHQLGWIQPTGIMY